jgi:hypothetical protein
LGRFWGNFEVLFEDFEGFFDKNEVKMGRKALGNGRNSGGMAAIDFFFFFLKNIKSSAPKKSKKIKSTGRKKQKFATTSVFFFFHENGTRKKNPKPLFSFAKVKINLHSLNFSKKFQFHSKKNLKKIK